VASQEDAQEDASNMTALILRSTLLWVGLFVLAFTNGALREVVWKKVVGIKEPVAHWLSCLTGTALWTAFVWLTWNMSGIRSIKEAALVGGYWFVLTVLTETFVINRLMAKLTWEQIIETYNVAKGQLWGLVLIWIGVLPVVVFSLKRP
jgi:hypothetical protein